MSHNIHHIFIAVARRLLDGLDRRSHQYEATNLLLDHYAVPYVRTYGPDASLTSMINDHMEAVFELDLTTRTGARKELDSQEHLTYVLMRSVLLNKYADLELADAMRIAVNAGRDTSDWVFETLACMRAVEDFAIICKQKAFIGGAISGVPLHQWWLWRCEQNRQMLSLTNVPAMKPYGAFGYLGGGMSDCNPLNNPIYQTPNYGMPSVPAKAFGVADLPRRDTSVSGYRPKMTGQLEIAVDQLIAMLESPEARELVFCTDMISLLPQKQEDTPFKERFNLLLASVTGAFKHSDYGRETGVSILLKGPLFYTWRGVLASGYAEPVLSYVPALPVKVNDPSTARTQQSLHTQALGDLLAIMLDPRSGEVKLGVDGLLVEQPGSSPSSFVSQYNCALYQAALMMLHDLGEKDVELNQKQCTGSDLVYMWVMKDGKRVPQFYFENADKYLHRNR